MKIIIEEAQYQCQYCKKIYNNIEEAIKCQKDCFKKTDKYEIRKLKQDLYLQDNINDFIKILKNIDLLKNNKQKNYKKIFNIILKKDYINNEKFEFENISLLNKIDFKKTHLYKTLKELNSFYPEYLKEKNNFENIEKEKKLNILHETEEYKKLKEEIKKLNNENDKLYIKNKNEISFLSYRQNEIKEKILNKSEEYKNFLEKQNNLKNILTIK